MYVRDSHYRVAGLLIIATCLAVLTACATLHGKTPEARADELFAQYTIAEERAAAIMQDARVPDDIKKGIQDANREASPVVEEMDAASVILKRARIENAEDIPGAIRELDALITRAAPLIFNLQRRTQL